MPKGTPKAKRNCKYCARSFTPTVSCSYFCSIKCRIEGRLIASPLLNPQCWGWTGSTGKNEHGYQFPTVGVKGKSKKASRVYYEIIHGPIPSGLCVLHTCDNPMCLNPNHLFLGTQKDNAKDRERKGRGKRNPVRGEKNNLAKLNEMQVRIIRRLYPLGGWTYAEIGKLFGICDYTVGNIIKRRNWVHI